MVKSDQLFNEKELSWLSFNERVLQEAADKNVPVIERVRFLGIFSNNQDEFFRVRVADVKRQILINKAQNEADHSDSLLKRIHKKVLKLQADFEKIFKEVSKELARHKIYLVEPKELSHFHRQWLKQYFKNNVLRHITPIIINETTDLMAHLSDYTTYLAVAIRQKHGTQYALLDVPTDALPRFILLPPEKTKKEKKIILLDDIIIDCLDSIFDGFFKFKSLDVYSFKITRDAEFGLSDEIDLSVVEQMSEGLKQRVDAKPTRVVYNREMDDDILQMLKAKMNISESDDNLLPGGRCRNFKDFIGFPNVGREYLENKPLPPFKSSSFVNHKTVFDAMKAKDILLYYPFHTFDHFTELVRQAAFDPLVQSIKLNIYRVAKNSNIISSLMDAVKNGKKVTVIVELKARFDESNNIEWAKIMTEAGIRVVFTNPTLKVHSKLCLINRMEETGLIRYAHLGTGNFHEKTARIYTDFSLFTCHKEICDEAANVFDFIENMYKHHDYQHLMVSPIYSRIPLTNLIDNEIVNARAGKQAAITVKVNNLVDKPLILKLYEASQAGVKIRMIIRGMCELVPGAKGLSENIEIISIVDRFLEHPRVMIFHNGGNEKVYISSADWMTRNIDHRVEVACPIYDEELKKRIKDIIALQFNDTTKARVIDAEQKNQYVKRGNRKKIRSQVAIYNYLKATEESELVK
ncbi:polyphosphate kinase 1 [Saccharobesus litoralis]|uniref:Polyphosphate kinase n=1 Tax=Saccharobesus litoralis TaxID=2172099 RepID=A0A2S0VSZ0_9ALTE|nr:polyphosphate kinase 1 [Saccharobesus litoralis]AWB67303.1 polyphosphate kinase 1 [Saccharobesus litoralis]